MKPEKIYLCSSCSIPLTSKLVRWLEEKPYCYYCFKRYSKKINQKGGNKNEIS